MFLNFLPIFCAFKRHEEQVLRKNFPAHLNLWHSVWNHRPTKQIIRLREGGGGHLVVLKDIKRNFEDLQDKKEYMSVHPTFYQPFLYECHFWKLFFNWVDFWQLPLIQPAAPISHSALYYSFLNTLLFFKIDWNPRFISFIFHKPACTGFTPPT